MFKNHDEKLSYSLGMNLGKQIASLNQKLDNPALFKGIQDGISGKEPLLSEDDMHAYLSSFEQLMSLKELELNRQKQNEQFLEENSQKAGVVTLPSGIQYKIVQMGEGKKPKKASQVLVHYRGFLIDGTEFGNTYESGQPDHFLIQNVILGWQEILPLMKVGDIWHVYIPPELAYGKEGYKDVIPPDAILVYQIELVGII